MARRIWRTTESSWEAPALLKRIYLDVSGRARGYIEIETEGGPLYFAGTAPHLALSPSEREARRNPLTLAHELIVTLPGEVQCSAMTLHHIAGLGEKAYTVKAFRPHLLNPVPTATVSFEEEDHETA